MKTMSIKPTITPLQVDFRSFSVAYKDNGNWRGFCYPYDISVEGKDRKEVMNFLKEQKELYEDGLKAYNYPEHLKLKSLTDEKDSQICNKVIFDLLNQKELTSGLKIRTTDYYVETNPA